MPKQIFIKYSLDFFLEPRQKKSQRTAPKKFAKPTTNFAKNGLSTKYECLLHEISTETTLIKNFHHFKFLKQHLFICHTFSYFSCNMHFWITRFVLLVYKVPILTQTLASLQLIILGRWV